MRNSPGIATLLCGALLTAVATNALAQQPDADDEIVDEIVVVAHKHARAVSDIAGNVIVLTPADINDTLSTSFSDVLRYTPGVDYESSGTRFGNEGINIRGIGGNRVATLVDGVPLSDQFDVGSFSNATRDFLNAGMIERAEILHGPASALYGSSAIGGVLAVRTPDPAKFLAQKNVGGSLLANYQGADGSFHGTGMIAFGSADKGLLIGGSLREGEQFDSAAIDDVLDLRQYTRRSALAKFVANDARDNTWRIGFIHQDSRVQSQLNSMLGEGRFRRTTALEGDDQYEMNLLNVSYEFGDSQGWIDAGVIRGYYQVAIVQQLTLDERGLATRPVSIDRYFEFDQEIRGTEINLQKSLSGRSTEHQLGFGIEYRQRQTEEYRDALETGIDDGLQTNVLLGEVFPLRDFPISHSSEWGAYIEDVMSIVAGHADAIGDKEYNIDLSERRAEAVVAYALSKGIASDRLTPVGFGFSQPVADNSTDEGRAKNRRIEFRVQEK